MKTKRPRVLLIGVHDKGLGEPFSPTTLSGKRLRRYLAEVKFDWALADMMLSTSLLPSEADLASLRQQAAEFDIVVLLGKQVQAAISCVFPEARCLPHPASRRPVDLKALQSGLSALGKIDKNA